MKQLTTLVGLSVAGITAIDQASAAINFGSNNVQDNVKGSGNTADVTVQNLFGNAMMFLGILAVLYGIYGGFLIVTAGGEEDKVKKGKTILVQVGMGLVIIFLANSIIQWVLGKLFTTST